MNNSFGPTSTTDEVLRGINLSGKRVLVTGASRGFGRAIAIAFGTEGETQPFMESSYFGMRGVLTMG